MLPLWELWSASPCMFLHHSRKTRTFHVMDDTGNSLKHCHGNKSTLRCRFTHGHHPAEFDDPGMQDCYPIPRAHKAHQPVTSNFVSKTYALLSTKLSQHKMNQCSPNQENNVAQIMCEHRIIINFGHNEYQSIETINTITTTL